MVINKKESECCGCTACVSICPKSAINMQDDDKGFKIPIVDLEKCIDCGLCDKVCPYNKIICKKENKDVEIYAVKRKNEQDRMASQSGGAFSSIAEYVIKNNGIVFGVKSDQYNVYYTRINNISELNCLKGSKYVQAEVRNTYSEVMNDLNKGLMVLYCGTACHINGLISFLKLKNIKTENLITCDLICHGVPSPKIFKEYYKYLKKKYGIISEFNFRSKKITGWRGSISSFKDNKNTLISSNNYANIFYSNLELRENCYDCPYASTNRIADITIGDFWGIEKYYKTFDDNKGCSVMILNTKKGRRIFENIKEDIVYQKFNIGECIQPNLQHPSEKPDEYNEFWNEYMNNGFLSAVTKYCDFNDKNDFKYSIINRIKRKSKYYLKKCLKKLI
ncbi:Coenzyme F420 hydrogenase/dehydrogenase, beta subunit C-terminal domain [Clostridium guangxiense]|uniref:Coenzyme F420 hydrogenase/dehydrogenase, beta subunit C-terminal domain n=1 Tax=Clostridium guangxiense TaxID=1662055 RepID=UPI001E44A095|nr:Coenzyme F420 hydrogenase/dehydrogenase, beta subunit C-terminal domain [Clostridium guangxiense]